MLPLGIPAARDPPAGEFSMAPKVPTLAGLIVLAACSTAGQRQTAENASIQQDAAMEVRRICALSESERQAEIQKVKKEAGVVVACGK
jgi:hypothetical protein